MPITNRITLSLCFHSFLSSLARFKYFSLFFFLFVDFYSMVGQDGKVHCKAIYLLFLFNTTSPYLRVGIWWSVCKSDPQTILFFSFSRRDSNAYLYHIGAWSNLHFLHNSLSIPFPTQLRLVRFCVKCTAFTYYETNLYVSITTYSCVLSILAQR